MSSQDFLFFFTLLSCLNYFFIHIVIFFFVSTYYDGVDTEFCYFFLCLTQLNSFYQMDKYIVSLTPKLFLFHYWELFFVSFFFFLLRQGSHCVVLAGLDITK